MILIINIFLLHFPKGFYECIGSNTAGEDIKTAQLIYAGKRIHRKITNHFYVEF